MVKINVPFDSDQHPKAILLQGDDITDSDCGQCHTPAEDWPRQVARHPGSRPGVMFQAELFCSNCYTWAFDENTGERVDSYTGEPDGGRPTDANHARMHRFLQGQANERDKQSANCLGCGERFMPDMVPCPCCEASNRLISLASGASTCMDCYHACLFDPVTNTRTCRVLRPDFRVEGEGPMTSVFRLVPLTDEAKEWVNDNVSREGFQPAWPTLYIEHRFLDDLIEGIEGEGMAVSAHGIQPVGAV